ncbi:MAG: ATP-binding protein [Halobacteriaceae archaeon]
MTDDYLEAFVRESEESITALNNSLLALEDDPDDEEAMEEIFRTAHTLKGNFGAMGFEDASDLAHAVEDLLDAIRSDDLAITPEVMDLVFAGVDEISVILDDIEADGESHVDPSETEAAIRAVLEEGPPDDAPTGADDASAPGDGAAEAATVEGLSDPAAAADADGGVFRVTVTVGETEMPGVDAMLALESAADRVEVLETAPDRDAVEDGDHGGEFAAFVVADGEATAAGAFETTDVAAVETREVTDAVAAAADGADDGGDGGASGDGGTAGAESAADGGGGDTAADEGAATGADGADGGSDGDDADGGSGGPSGGTAVSTENIKSVRVDVEQLDDLHGLIEQLVTSRIKLRQSVEDGDEKSTGDNLDELDKITSNLQSTVMDMRLIPVKKAVNKFPRMVRDLAREEGKEIDFEMVGVDVELDRTILDEISDPLMHVIRNAVDHGIEPPDERERKGKPREGQIRLRAERERDHVTITVEDDGAGLDVDRIKETAREEGIRTERNLDEADDGDVYDLVYHPGFSTSEEVTDVSGRGVGMDVVHSTVTRLDGSVSVDSEPDEGTAVTLRLPVSVAIVRVLFVEVGTSEFGIPIKNIDEVSNDEPIRTVNGEEVVPVGDTAYPLVRLEDALDSAVAADGGEGGMFLRIREDEREAVLRCDDVTQQEEVVIKPFQGQLSDVEGLSGTAVVGDGKVVPILDVGTL